MTRAGGGQSSGQTLPNHLCIGRHETRVVRQAGQKGFELLGRLRGLERGQQRQESLRTLHLVDDLEPIDPLTLLLELDRANDLQDVESDALLRRQARRTCRPGLYRGSPGKRLSKEPLSPLPTFGPGVVQPIHTLLVSEHGGRDRREIQDAVPETICQRVHRVGCVAHVDHQSLHPLGSGRTHKVARR